MKYHIILFVILSVLDILTTIIALENGGMEANPIAAYVISVGGYSGLILFKTAGVVTICCLFRYLSKWIHYFVNVITALAVLNNTYHLLFSLS